MYDKCSRDINNKDQIYYTKYPHFYHDQYCIFVRYKQVHLYSRKSDSKTEKTEKIHGGNFNAQLLFLNLVVLEGMPKFSAAKKRLGSFGICRY